MFKQKIFIQFSRQVSLFTLHFNRIKLKFSGRNFHLFFFLQKKILIKRNYKFKERNRMRKNYMIKTPKSLVGLELIKSTVVKLLLICFVSFTRHMVNYYKVEHENRMSRLSRAFRHSMSATLRDTYILFST